MVVVLQSSLPFISFHLLILLTCKVSKLWIKIFSTSDEEIFPMEASCYTWLNIDRNPFGSRANQCSPVGGIEAVVKAIKISGARGWAVSPCCPVRSCTDSCQPPGWTVGRCEGGSAQCRRSWWWAGSRCPCRSGPGWCWGGPAEGRDPRSPALTQSGHRRRPGAAGRSPARDRTAGRPELVSVSTDWASPYTSSCRIISHNGGWWTCNIEIINWWLEPQII